VWDWSITLGAAASAVAIPSFGILVWQQVQSWRRRAIDWWWWRRHFDLNNDRRAKCMLMYIGTGGSPSLVRIHLGGLGGIQGVDSGEHFAEQGQPIEFTAWWVDDETELLVEYLARPFRHRKNTKLRRFPLSRRAVPEGAAHHRE
jgi:hypothetical protein